MIFRILCKNTPYSTSLLIHCLEETKVKLVRRVRLFAAPWTVAYQALPSMGFSSQEYWSGLPFASPQDLPNSGLEPGSHALHADALPSEPPGKQSETCPQVVLEKEIVKKNKQTSKKQQQQQLQNKVIRERKVNAEVHNTYNNITKSKRHC